MLVLIILTYYIKIFKFFIYKNVLSIFKLYSKNNLHKTKGTKNTQTRHIFISRIKKSLNPNHFAYNKNSI